MRSFTCLKWSMSKMTSEKRAIARRQPPDGEVRASSKPSPVVYAVNGSVRTSAKFIKWEVCWRIRRRRWRFASPVAASAAGHLPPRGRVPFRWLSRWSPSLPTRSLNRDRLAWCLARLWRTAQAIFSSSIATACAAFHFPPRAIRHVEQRRATPSADQVSHGGDERQHHRHWYLNVPESMRTSQ